MVTFGRVWTRHGRRFRANAARVSNEGAGCLVNRFVSSNRMVPRLVRLLSADEEWHDLVLCKMPLACLGRDMGWAWIGAARLGKTRLLV